MASILYKFRSANTFEALPLPGSSARLWDVKKAIVTAKDLGRGAMDFDLQVEDAASGIKYLDDSEILPRGSRLVVQRLPAMKGHGILARIARNPDGSNAQPPAGGGAPAVPADFYTIDSTARDDDQYVSATASSNNANNGSSAELEALRAATAVAPNNSVGTQRGAPPPRNPANYRPRPNADPELRDQQLQDLPKKRATGIPRTFLGAMADNEASGQKIQPNALGFQELVHRGGGQSANAAGTTHDLEYALKLTATSIPEYLQCAICHNVVQDAMLLPWDNEGRTTCESCIRTALTDNGFRCPLTQLEAVSPDELIPNRALRKAAEQFVQQVMEKVSSIVEEEQQQKVEDEIVPETAEEKRPDAKVVLTRRATADEMRQQQQQQHDSDDDFGGDVFAVEKPKVETQPAVQPVTVKSEPSNDDVKPVEPLSATSPQAVKTAVKTEESKVPDESTSAAAPAAAASPKNNSTSPPTSNSVSKQSETQKPVRRRGPPVGYTMGPAGGNAGSPEAPSPRGGGGRYPDRGGRGGGGGYHNHHPPPYGGDDGPRGTKRSYPGEDYYRGGGGGGRGHHYRGGGGGFRGGGRGRWDDHSYRGGRFRGGGRRGGRY